MRTRYTAGVWYKMHVQQRKWTIILPARTIKNIFFLQHHLPTGSWVSQQQQRQLTPPVSALYACHSRYEYYRYVRSSPAAASGCFHPLKKKKRTHAFFSLRAFTFIFTCSRRAVHTRNEWISCIELASTRVYPVRKSSRTNTTPRTINSGVCVRNNLRSWKGWDQKTKNLDFFVLCRCVRVVKEMDLKPIVISRAGSNPVADGDFFFPGVTSKTDTRGDGRTDILLVLHSYLVRKAQINELCRHSSYGCIEYQVHTTYTCMCTCMRTLIILNLHFLLLRGAIVNRTKYC